MILMRLAISILALALLGLGLSLNAAHSQQDLRPAVTVPVR